MIRHVQNFNQHRILGKETGTAVILCRGTEGFAAAALGTVIAEMSVGKVVMIADDCPTAATAGLDIVRLANKPPWPVLVCPLPVRPAWAAYAQLRDLDPDVVIAYGSLDLIYIALQARACGVAFHNARFVAVATRPTLYTAELEARAITSPAPLIRDHLERTSLGLADVAVAEDQGVMNWLLEAEWAAQRLVLAPSKRPTVARLTEPDVVHFGPIEHGFTNRALRCLADQTPRRHLDILAHPDDAEAVGSLADVANVTVVVDPRIWLRQQDSVGRVVVATSARADFAAMQAACDACGARLLRLNFSDSRAATPEGLRDLVTSAVHAPTSDPQALWEMLQQAMKQPMVSIEARPVRISVCMVHHERPHLLLQALKAIARQTLPPSEIVLVDDGSRSPAAERCLRRLEPIFAARGWTLIRQPNRYLGAARNAAARAARGDYLLFHDDDNIAVPGQLEAFAKAALRSGADVITSLLAPFRGPHRPPDAPREVWAPLGGAPVAYSLVANGFGDANALVRRSVFDQIGGFSEDYGIGYEDWEFFARAALAGAAFLLVPEPLIWYRVSRGMLRTAPSHTREHIRVLRPYLKALPPTLRPVALLAQGLALGDDDDWRFNFGGTGGQALLRELLESRSWRWTAALRAFFHHPEIATGVGNAETGKAAVVHAVMILSSTLWDVMAPLRLIERLARAMPFGRLLKKFRYWLH